MELVSLDGYLRQLPKGLDSYPELRCKGSLIRNLVTAKSLPSDALAQLPSPLRALCEGPIPVSSWYPEVHLAALMYAYLDGVFGGDEDAFVNWFYELAERLYRSPLYRFLMVVSSPSRLMRGVSSRWGTFHRGSSAKLIRHGERDVELVVDVPSQVYPPPIARTVAPALIAAIRASGGRNAHHTVNRRDDGSLHLRLSWERS